MLQSNSIKLLNKVTAVFILVVYLLPIIINWGNSEIRIHDNLDSFHVYEVLIDSGKVFTADKHAVIENIMNGLPRNCFPSGYNIVILLMMAFGVKAGFFINYLLVHITGFTGMLLLLNGSLNKKDEYGINWLLAAAFAALPVNTLTGASMTGIPLVFYAFDQLRLKQHLLSSFLLLVYYCLYSSLIHTGIFVMGCIGLGFLALIFKKQANFYYFGGLAALILCYAFIESDLIRSILFSKEYISHRTNFIHDLTLNAKGVIGMAFLTIVNGHYSSANYFGLPILILAVTVIVYSFVKKEFVKPVFLLFLIITLVGLFIGAMDWKALAPVYAKFGFLDSFNFKRFHFLLPVFMYVLAALCFSYLLSKHKGFILLFTVFSVSMIVYNFKLDKAYNINAEHMTFNQFFSKDLFRQIDEYIHLPKNTYRVVSIGIDPVPSQCSGFYTLDSYQNNYPLEYKEKFKKIIEHELDKDPKEAKYFEEWGNRCYVPSHISTGPNGENVIADLSINTTAFKNMGGKFIFSNAGIANAQQLQLKLDKIFTHPDSKYIIYLYETI